MAMKDTAGSSATKTTDVAAFLNWGQERTEAALALQKDLLSSYEQASRAWLARVQLEVTLWSDLATKLTGTRTVPEAFDTYAKCVSERMKMAADDGARLADEATQITQKLMRSLNGAR